MGNWNYRQTIDPVDVVAHYCESAVFYDNLDVVDAFAVVDERLRRRGC